MSEQATEVRIHIPDNIRYQCRMDGKCCTLYDIPIDPDSEERILRVDWRYCSDLDETERSPFIRRKKNAGEQFMRQTDGSCHFLDERNLCRLQKTYGMTVKPLACQRFPFRFTRSPDGDVYAGVSFACPSISEADGPPAETHREEIERLYGLSDQVREISTPLRFDSSTPISWESYLKIESVLDEILSREDKPLGICLVAGHAWLGMLGKLVRSISINTGNVHGTEEERIALFSGVVDRYIEHGRGEGFQQSFAIAERPAGNPALKRMMLGSFVSFRSALTKPGGRLALTARVIFQNARHWARLGSIQLPPLDERAPYRRFHPEYSNLTGKEYEALLRRYFRHVLFRKDLVTHTDLFWGYGYMVLAHGLMQWYATALKATGSERLEEALSLVEQYYMHHSSFNQAFLYHPAMANIVQHLFRKPNFAHTIVLG